jgi:hypothetical protein
MQRITFTRALSCLAIVTSLGVIPAFASPKANPPKVHAPKAHAVAPVQAKGPKAKAPAPVHPAHPATAKEVKTPKQPKTHGTKPTPAVTTTKPAKTDRFVTRIENNSHLMSRLQPLLPPGYTIATAADGFKNQGQFIAALHVSRNLNIPFAQLKAAMVGPDHLSLGQAIQQLRPTAPVTTAVRTAENEAQEDVRPNRTRKTEVEVEDEGVRPDRTRKTEPEDRDNR